MIIENFSALILQETNTFERQRVKSTHELRQIFPEISHATFVNSAMAPMILHEKEAKACVHWKQSMLSANIVNLYTLFGANPRKVSQDQLRFK